LRVRCIRAIPIGKVPKAFLPHEPRWWSPSAEKTNHGEAD
jgi:hypothetical protein